MKSEDTMETILRDTIDLIHEADGHTEQVTIRKIAERANVGVGLINHYFHSKDKLIEQCVQRIISGIVSSFQPDLSKTKSAADRVRCAAKQVMDFLMSHKEISRVSMLSDLNQPQCDDNSMKTVQGFAFCHSGENPGKSIQINAFLLTGAMQTAFLRKETLKDTLGIDLYDKEQRDRYIDLIINKLIEPTH